MAGKPATDPNHRKARTPNGKFQTPRPDLIAMRVTANTPRFCASGKVATRVSGRKC